MLLFIAVGKQHAFHIRAERHCARAMFKLASFRIGQADGKGLATGNLFLLDCGGQWARPPQLSFRVL
jgi:hypothetical protein